MIFEWLINPIDPGRMHNVGFAVSWHARSMTLAWGVLAPLAVFVARYFKVLPWQDFPRELDSTVWWRSHWMANSLVFFLTIIGIVLIYTPSIIISLHGILGYTVFVLAMVQIGLGLYRGTKGGPTAPSPDGSVRGDHYDMTPWRLAFEKLHKSIGYATLFIAAVAIILGLWHANAPRWMWIVILGWWIILAICAVILQRRGWAFDTYQAIWGPGLEHPGNRIPSQGWGMQRYRIKDDEICSE